MKILSTIGAKKVMSMLKSWVSSNFLSLNGGTIAGETEFTQGMYSHQCPLPDSVLARNFQVIHYMRIYINATEDTYTFPIQFSLSGSFWCYPVRISIALKNYYSSLSGSDQMIIALLEEYKIVVYDGPDTITLYAVMSDSGVIDLYAQYSYASGDDGYCTQLCISQIYAAPGLIFEFPDELLGSDNFQTIVDNAMEVVEAVIAN